jgi:tetratricopeptide (TPR) repeat protein
MRRAAVLLGLGVCAFGLLRVAPALARGPVPAQRPDREANHDSALPSRSEESDGASALADGALAAYGASDYATAQDLASRYVEWARAEGRPGRRLAEILFVMGHSRYEIQHKNQEPYAGDYRTDVVAPLEESFRVLQDNAAFKTLILGNAYYELWAAGGRKDAEAEGQAHWYLLKSILIREGETAGAAPGSPERERFARFLLFYLDRCLEMARVSATSDLYIYRIRAAAPRGLSSPYADRFRQIYDLTYFDSGNMRAAALWQYALDSAQDHTLAVDEVVARFQDAAEACRLDKSKAEIERQVADYLAVLDLPERRAQAADFARRAFELDPSDPEIRRQFGSALHVLSFGAYASGRFEDALRFARQAVAFDWQGIELAHFDLSRAAAELGRAEEAIAHGEEAYRTARRSADGPGLQPYAQNFINVLRQFGQDDLADRVVHEASSPGVH